MNRTSARGLFITGTGTGVGKTYVGAMIARALAGSGCRVGVYKPAASGCRQPGQGKWSCEDAEQLRRAAGREEPLSRVCPQMFAAPLAPHRAARLEGRRVDAALLRQGLHYWLDCSDVVLVEGAGGLMSPLGDEDYVADIAYEFGFPLVVVAANVLGTINHTLQTLITASSFREGLEVAGIVLSDVQQPQPSTDPSRESNREELEMRCVPPLLAHVGWQADDFCEPVDWLSLARAPMYGRG